MRPLSRVNLHLINWPYRLIWQMRFPQQSVQSLHTPPRLSVHCERKAIELWVRGESGVLTVAHSVCELSRSHLFIVCMHARTHSLMCTYHTRTHAHNSTINTHKTVDSWAERRLSVSGATESNLGRLMWGDNVSRLISIRIIIHWPCPASISLAMFPTARSSIRVPLILWTRLFSDPQYNPPVSETSCNPTSCTDWLFPPSWI